MLIARNLVFPGFGRGNQGDVQSLDASYPVHLAPVGFEVQFVNADGRLFDVPQCDFYACGLIGAENPFGNQFKLLVRHFGNPALGLVLPRPPIEFSIGFEGPFQVAEVLFVNLPDSEQGQ